jgi:hypothetical protein
VTENVNMVCVSAIDAICVKGRMAGGKECR